MSGGMCEGFRARHRDGGKEAGKEFGSFIKISGLTQDFFLQDRIYRDLRRLRMSDVCVF